MLCASRNQTELAAEMNVHLPGLQKLDETGIFVFPKLLVCMDCGFSRFTMPASELALLARGAPTAGAPTRRESVDPAAPNGRIAL